MHRTHVRDPSTLSGIDRTDAAPQIRSAIKMTDANRFYSSGQHMHNRRRAAYRRHLPRLPSLQQHPQEIQSTTGLSDPCLCSDFSLHKCYIPANSLTRGNAQLVCSLDFGLVFGPFCIVDVSRAERVERVKGVTVGEGLVAEDVGEACGEGIASLWPVKLRSSCGM